MVYDANNLLTSCDSLAGLLNTCDWSPNCGGASGSCAGPPNERYLVFVWLVRKIYHLRVGFLGQALLWNWREQLPGCVSAILGSVWITPPSALVFYPPSLDRCVLELTRTSLQNAQTLLLIDACLSSPAKVFKMLTPQVFVPSIWKTLLGNCAMASTTYSVNLATFIV